MLKFCIHNAYFNKWPIKKNYQNNLLKICLCCHFLCQPKKFLWNYFISQCIAFQWGSFFRTKLSNRSITRLFNQKKFLLNQQEFKKLQNQFATRGPILGEWFVLTQIRKPCFSKNKKIKNTKFIVPKSYWFWIDISKAHCLSLILWNF